MPMQKATSTKIPTQILDGIDEKVVTAFVNPVNQLLNATSSENGISVAQNLNSQVQEFSVTIPDPWTVIPASDFLNGWVDTGGGVVGPSRYMKHPDGTVELQLNFKSGTIATPVTILPPEYRPQYDMRFIVFNGSAAGPLWLRSNGEVIPLAGAVLDWTVIVRYTGSQGGLKALSCWPYVFKTKFGSKPLSVTVSDVYDITNNTQSGQRVRVGSVCNPDWDFVQQNGSNSISIRNIAYLPYGRKFSIKLTIFGD